MVKSPPLRRFVLFGLCLCLGWTTHARATPISLGATAQVKPRPDGLWPVRTYTVTGRVWGFEQTKDGRLWLGGSQGLQTFDGKAFTPIEGSTEPRGEIRALVKTPNGSLYVGGIQGVWRLAPGAIQFQKLGTPGEGVQALLPKGDEVWVGTQRGLFWTHGNEMHFVPHSEHLWICALASLGGKEDLWVGTSAGMWILQGAQLKESWPGSQVHAIAKAPDGSWYAGTEDHGLLRHRNGQWQRSEEPQSDPTVLSVVFDGSGLMWVGHSSGVITSRGGRPGPALRTKDLPATRVHGVFVDSAQNVWLALDGNAIAEVRQDLAIRSYQTEATELPFAMAESTQGGMWMTVGNGLQRWDDANITDVRSINPPLWTLRSLQPDPDGSLWASDYGAALVRVSNKNGAYEIDGVPIDTGKLAGASSTYMAPDGALWLGFPNGDVVTRHDNTMIRYAASPSGCPAGVLRMLKATPDDLLVASNGRGLCVLHITSKTFERLGTDAENRIAITSLAKLSDGDVWVGSLQNGVGRLRSKQLTWVGYDQGLRAELVGAILEDRSKNIWLLARSGIFRIPQGQLAAAADRSLHQLDPLVFSTADGLLNSDCISGWAEPAVIDKRGRLWALTLKGPLVMDHPERLAAPKWHAPEVVSVLLNGLPVPANPARTFAAPAAQGNLEVHYRAVALSEGRRLRYRYMLEGFDKTWIEADARTEAFYTNLPPRHYKFRLEASLAGMATTLRMPPFSLQLVPPFYRTTPFYLVSAAALFAVVASIMRMSAANRRRQQQLLATERRRISQDIHDSLEQTFVAMRFQVDAARRALGENQPALGPLDRTMSLMNRAMKETRAAIWALRAEFPGKADLVTQIAIIAGEASQGQGMQVKVNTLGQPFGLPAEIQRQAVQITREALSNAMKHAHAQQVLVEISFTEKAAVLEIKDDGQGFSLSQAASLEGHYGLSGMRERAEQIRAKLEITSQPGEGTLISLTITRPSKAKKPV